MKKIFLSGFVALLVFGALFFPKVSSASTVAELQAQISSLMAQLGALQTSQNNSATNQLSTNNNVGSVGISKVKILSPNGGEVFSGFPIKISWMQDSSISYIKPVVRLEKYIDGNSKGGPGYMVVGTIPSENVTGTETNHTLLWYGQIQDVNTNTTHLISPGQYNIDVSYSNITNPDGSGYIYEDRSDSYFTVGGDSDCYPGAMFSSKTGMKCNAGENVSTNTVTNVSSCVTCNIPTIAVTSPNGGEKWIAGSNQLITWKTTNIPNDVKIRLQLQRAVEGGTDFVMIFGEFPNDGQEMIKVPNVPSGEYKMLVVYDPSPGLPGDYHDFSDSSFQIVSSGNSVTTLSTKGPVYADVTGDSRVNVDDLLFVINHWGPCSTLTSAVAGIATCTADIDHDGTVNGVDLDLVSKNWTKTP